MVCWIEGGAGFFLFGVIAGRRRRATGSIAAGTWRRRPSLGVSAVCALWNFGLAGWCLYPLARGCRAPRRMRPELAATAPAIPVWRYRLVAGAAELGGSVADRGAGNDAVRDLDAHASTVRLINAAEDLDQCRLSGAVFAAQRMNLTGGAVKAHAIQRPHAGEALADVEHFQSECCLHHVIFSRAARSTIQRR